MKMTTAEFRGYQQICERGGGPMMVIACDQRGGMRKLLATNPEEEAAIGQDILGNTKSDIVQFLGNHASCVLLDPVCAVPRVIDEAVLARDAALVIGLDDSGWDVQPGTRYRLSKLVPGISARRVRELGGTGGKIMVYLRSDLPAANEHNIEILKQVIADFAAEDLLLVVEFLTYQVDGESADDYATKFSALIEGGTKICLEVGSKVLKLPYPGTGQACAKSRSSAATSGPSFRPASTTRPL
jgi:tagatose 1,6-diphosphate aldolase